jgi:hypothetical protein
MLSCTEQACFGEHYQCGYWTRLISVGGLLRQPRGSIPPLSASLPRRCFLYLTEAHRQVILSLLIRRVRTEHVFLKKAVFWAAFFRLDYTPYAREIPIA